jgi:hypothetical protein
MAELFLSLNSLENNDRKPRIVIFCLLINLSELKVFSESAKELRGLFILGFATGETAKQA